MRSAESVVNTVIYTCLCVSVCIMIGHNSLCYVCYLASFLFLSYMCLILSCVFIYKIIRHIILYTLHGPILCKSDFWKCIAYIGLWTMQNIVKWITYVMWQYKMKSSCNCVVNISDAVYLINYIFGGGPAPVPLPFVGDVDCSHRTNISDVVYMISWIFGGGPAPCAY